MKADFLVDVLMELNIINVGDIDRELVRLAARLLDTRAQKWFLRVPRYFIINIDLLAKEPYVVKAEPRSQKSSKYNFHPQTGWEPGQEPNDLGVDKWKERKYAGDPGCTKCYGTKLLGYVIGNNGNRHEKAADLENDSEAIRATYHTCDKCNGTGEHHKPEFRELKRSLAQHSDAQTELNTRQADKQSELDYQRAIRQAELDNDYALRRRTDKRATREVIPREVIPSTDVDEIVSRIKSLRQPKYESRSLTEQDDPENQYDPENQTYTTNDSHAEKDIEQSFTKFNPKTAKKTRMHGEPPTASEVPDWMLAQGDKGKEFHHFNPIQVRRRELFSRLDDLVNYLNYQISLTSETEFTTSETEQRTIEADKLIQDLDAMEKEDVQGFRKLLIASAEFKLDVETKPWMFTGDGRIVATSGNLTMRKIIYVKTAIENTERPIDINKWPDTNSLSPSTRDKNVFWPRWCTKQELNANDYLNKRSPAKCPTAGTALYFIDKEGEPYVLVHFPSNQVKNPYNIELTSSSPIFNEIAPLFINEKRFPRADLEFLNSTLATRVEHLRVHQQRANR